MLDGVNVLQIPPMDDAQVLGGTTQPVFVN